MSRSGQSLRAPDGRVTEDGGDVTYVRAQIGFIYDTQLPRDVMLVTPHYSTNNVAALGDALVANLKANAQVLTKPFTVNLYDATAPSPGGPMYSGGQAGSTPNSITPREVAICLSYYGGFKRPTFRGRLYLPAQIVGTPSVKQPSNAQMVAAGSFATTFGKNLPSGSYWVVWSRKKSSAAQVTDWWVDNEWDTVRSRGMKADSRVTGKLP